MDQLNKEILKREGMTNKLLNAEKLPEKIIQFGEGNFLRAFIDWMVHEMNRKGVFNGRVIAIQPTPHGKVVPKLNEQDGLYTVVLRGVMNGEKTKKAEIITSVSRGINPYKHWEEVLKAAEDEEVQIVISNTTEAGLTYKKEEFIPGQSPSSFPGKLTAFLFHRYQTLKEHEHSGMTIIPCELLEGNGDLLKRIVLKISEDWQLPHEFKGWIQQNNKFCNTLVDRIVTGFPKEEITAFHKELGYTDKLLTVGEPYHLLAIDGDEETQNLIPFKKAGLNVRWGEVSSIRRLKTRVLNGAHTMMFAVGFLAGKKTVFEVIQDKKLHAFISRAIHHEFLPALDYKENEKNQFAEATLERFLNPYIKHHLLDIGLNSVFKFKSRLLPTIMDHQSKFGKLPNSVVCSLAALILLYRPKRIEGDFLFGRRGDEDYKIRDDKENINFFDAVWKGHSFGNEQLKPTILKILSERSLWGMDLTQVKGLSDLVCGYAYSIAEQGIDQAIEQI